LQKTDGRPEDRSKTEWTGAKTEGRVAASFALRRIALEGPPNNHNFTVPQTGRCNPGPPWRSNSCRCRTGL